MLIAKLLQFLDCVKLESVLKALFVKTILLKTHSSNDQLEIRIRTALESTVALRR
jgi:hypothetical protein